jgi:hypothetical protein
MVAVPMLATVMVIVQVLYVDQLAARSASADGVGTGRRPGFDPDLDEVLEKGGAAIP